MSKLLRYTLPMAACLFVVVSSGNVPAGGEGVAGSRARSVHAARAPMLSEDQTAELRHDTGNVLR